MRNDQGYSIKQLESLTNVKAHTIRIWEKRYGILEPFRTATNVRKYSDEDLKKLLSVTALVGGGHKISVIAEMSQEERNLAVNSLFLSKTKNTGQTESMILFMLNLNEQGISTIINEYSEKVGFESCVEELLFPFFERIGVMWQTGAISPAQEHFISAIVRAHLIKATTSIPPASLAGPPVILFLPEDELHELSLLFYNYILRLNGYATLYLGQSVPYYSLPQLILQSGAEKAIFVSTATANLNKLTDTLTEINTMKVKMYATGNQLTQIDMTSYPHISVFENKTSLLRLLGTS